MPQVFWTKLARAQLIQVHAYLEQRNPDAARELVLALFEAGQSLADLPNRGRHVPGSQLREIIAGDHYIIRYRVSSKGVVIRRIRHGARRPTQP